MGIEYKPKFSKRRLTIIEAEKEIIEKLRPLLYSQGFIDWNKRYHKIKTFDDLSFKFIRIEGVEIHRLSISTWGDINISIDIKVLDHEPNSIEEISPIVSKDFFELYNANFRWLLNSNRPGILRNIYYFPGYYRFGFFLTMNGLKRQSEKLFNKLSKDLSPTNIDLAYEAWINERNTFVVTLDNTILRYYKRSSKNK